MIDRRGFTLIELLVSISIFGVVTGFLMANFRTGRTADELRIGAQNLVSALRETQTMSFSGRLVSVCRNGANNLKLCQVGVSSSCPGGTCTQEVAHGYGLRANTASGSSASLIIYADTNGDHAYNAGEAINTRALSPSARVTIKTVAPASSGLLDIVFDPPKPSIYYNNSTATTQATITVQHSTSGAVRDVTMNRVSGQISSN